MTKCTHSQRGDMARAFLEGKSSTKIARENSVSETYVLMLAKAYAEECGIDLSSRPRAKRERKPKVRRKAKYEAKPKAESVQIEKATPDPHALGSGRRQSGEYVKLM